MDNMLVWILIFAGATIGLLGVFLIASERELKIKRQELGVLETRLMSAPVEIPPEPTVETQPLDNTAALDVVMNNKKLQDEVASLSAQLDEDQHTIDEFRSAQHRLANVQAENDQLRAINQQLTEGIASLKTQLHGSETPGGESDGQPLLVGDGQSSMQIAMVELQQKLAESQMQVRELEGTQQQVADLNRDLDAAQNKVRDLDAANSRMAEMERLQQHLQGDNQRLRSEIEQWQKRLAESEERRNQLDQLRQRLQELQSKQASLTAGHRQFQDDLVAAARLLESDQPINADTADLDDITEPQNGENGHPTASLTAPGDQTLANGSEPTTQSDGQHAASHGENESSTPNSGKGKRRSRAMP